MADERRKARRARIPGMRVTFEGAAGERAEADVLDVGSGGLFIRTAKPVAPGKRLSLEVPAFAGLEAWSALGRVVWTRETGTKDAAPGMGVKLIDVDDALVAAIDRLVDDHERTQPRTGAGAPPAREPTVHGLGTPQDPPVAASPIVPVAPARERTVLGVGAAPAPAVAKPPPRERSVQEPPPEDWDVPNPHEMPTREIVVPQRVLPVPQEKAPAPKPSPEPDTPPPPLAEASIAIDLVAKKPAVAVDPEPLPEVPRRRGGRWLLVLLVVAAVAAAALYASRDRLPWVQRLVDTWAASPPAPAPAPVAPSTPPVQSTTAAPTTPPSPAASPTPSSTGSARGTPSALPGPSNLPAHAAPAAPSGAQPAKRPAGDNPY